MKLNSWYIDSPDRIYPYKEELGKISFLLYRFGVPPVVKFETLTKAQFSRRFESKVPSGLAWSHNCIEAIFG